MTWGGDGDEAPTPIPAPKSGSAVKQPFRLHWGGEVPSQKWTNVYTKVLSHFAIGKGLRLVVSAEVTDPAGISQQKIDEMKVALRELGLSEELTLE